LTKSTVSGTGKPNDYCQCTILLMCNCRRCSWTTEGDTV